jgi:Ca-activated chloride channel family protein
MPFDPDDPRLTAFALGELDAADRETIEAILRDDPDGRAFVLGIEATARLLSEELRHETDAANGLDPSRRETIEERLVTTILPMPVASPEPKRSHLGLKFLMFGVAASLVGVAVGFLLAPVVAARKSHIQLAKADAPAATPEMWGWKSDSTAPSQPAVASVAVPTPSEAARGAKPAIARASGIDAYDTAPGKPAAGEMAPAAKLPALAQRAEGRQGLGYGTNVNGPVASPAAAEGFADQSGKPTSLGLAVRERDTRLYESEKLAANSARRGLGTSPPNQAGGSMMGRMDAGTAGMGGGMGMGGMGNRIGGMGGGMGGIGGGMGGMPGSAPATADPSRSLAAKKSNQTFDLQLPGGRNQVLARSKPASEHFGLTAPAPTMAAPPASGPQAVALDLGKSGGRKVAVKSLDDASKLKAGLTQAPQGDKPLARFGDLDGDKANFAKSNTQAGMKGMVGQEQKVGERDANQVSRASSYAALLPPAAAGDAKPAEDSKRGEPETRMALNNNGINTNNNAINTNNNDLGQQRVDALNLAVVTKEAELQQLNQQAEILRRRADEERARVDREAYARLYDNPFTNVVPGNQLSTFAIDVDTASYANIRRFLVQGQLPPVDAVRIEEMVNYFSYNDPAPTGPDPFSVNVEIAACPWDGSHRLARIGLKGKEIAADKRPPSNLVFLIDVSGSMNDLNKLPMLKAGMKLLVGQLTENDRVAIVTYANGDRVALPSTPCHNKGEILAVLDGLNAGGGTNGGAGVQKAYELAQANFIKGGTNRVILATDGDFNVGLTKEQLLATSEERAKKGIFLSVLGFGQGNIQEDFMEQLADKGNGNYSYIDTIDEARRVLVTRIAGTLVVIAKDVKVQVEFNPDKVAAYRLIGYENRVMANEDFRNDKKDAGEIGAGHSVTALYEIVPSAAPITKDAAAGRPLKYQRALPANVNAADKAVNPETLTVFLRYKQPDGDKATEFNKGVTDDGRDFGRASTNLKFSAAVAGFGMILRESPFKGSITLPGILEIAGSALGDDKSGDRKEFLELVKQAERILHP